MNYRSYRCSLWWGWLLPALLLALPVRAQQPFRPAPQGPGLPDSTALADSLPIAGLPTGAEMEAFFDGLITGVMEAHHVAGATVSVVQGDSLFFAKGYGFADLGARTPARAGETLFRVGSVSKLFVWTAVMQLVEAGELDLNADVNTYLKDFQVPATYEQPVTLTHLMTHTAGFEDQVIGLFARDPARLRPLGEILQEELPARVHPPGEVASYSNHGSALAAYIVEQVSGLPWSEYVEQRILQPLGMAHTTFRQPVPETLMVDLSKGYRFDGGDFIEEGFEFVPLAPIGAASASATDMARFMRAHLNRGRLGRTAILDTATARQMQATLFTPAPGLNGQAHGFYEMSRNGYHVIGHGGDTFWFHSLLALLPVQNVGLFISFNSDGGGAATGEVYDAFMDTFFPPEKVPTLVVDAGAADRLDHFAGHYRPVRYSHTTLAKLAVAASTIDVSVTDDGKLKTSGDETRYWIETGPQTFREEHTLGRLAFREDEGGNVTHLIFGDLPIVAFERVGAWVLPAFQFSLAVAVLLIVVLALIGWPLAAWTRRRHKVQVGMGETQVPIFARGLAWLACLAFIVFAVLFAVAMGDPNQIVFGLPPLLKTALWMPAAGAVLTALAFLFVPVIWLLGWGRTGARLWYTLVVLACGLFLWQLYYWNLLTFILG